MGKRASRLGIRLPVMRVRVPGNQGGHRCGESMGIGPSALFADSGDLRRGSLPVGSSLQTGCTSSADLMHGKSPILSVTPGIICLMAKRDSHDGIGRR